MNPILEAASLRQAVPQASQVRKRRRWMIAATIFVLVLLVSWWYWPRGDVRFVGRWNWSDTLPGSQPHSIMILSRNGVGMGTVLASGESHSFPWHVEGDRLVMGHGSAGSAPFLRRVQQWLNDALGGSPIVPAHAWEIVEINSDSFLIRAVPTHRPIRCTRIAE